MSILIESSKSVGKIKSKELFDFFASGKKLNKSVASKLSKLLKLNYHLYDTERFKTVDSAKVIDKSDDYIVVQLSVTTSHEIPYTETDADGYTTQNYDYEDEYSTLDVMITK